MKTCPQLYVGGCSGSCNPNSAKSRFEFGTNTTSFGVVVGDVGFFIDNGTGIGNVVEFLGSHKLNSVYGLQTHFHLDHCAGLPMNALFFRRDGIRKIFAPKLGQKTFADVVEKSFETQTWPISPKMFQATQEIVSFTPGEAIKEIWTTTMPVSHPGGSVAYRIMLPEGDLVIATDSELADEKSLSSMAKFIAGAKLVYFDVQYQDAEYEGLTAIGPATNRMSRKNWGHSTPSMIRKVLEMSGTHFGGMPKRIIVGHHDPRRVDADLSLFEQEVKGSFKDLPVAVRFAREGDVYDIC